MRVIVEQPFFTTYADRKYISGIDMNFHKETKIMEIKRAVSLLTEIPQQYFNLIQLEKPKEILKEIKNLSDYTSAGLVRLKMVTDISRLRRGNTMQIFYKTLTRTITIHVSEQDSINVIKQMIYRNEKIPIGEQRLIYGGQELDGGTLLDNKIGEEATLYLILRHRD